MNASQTKPGVRADIQVALTPALYHGGADIVVAVDVLRATTAICAAFQAGADEIVPLDSLDALWPYRAKGYLLAAERGGLKVGDAEYGNSPTEYLRNDLHGRRLAYSTTNGTRCILRGADAKKTLVGSFANISVLADHLIQSASSCEAAGRECTITIICSGWEGIFCIEDTLFAGALIEQLTAQPSILNSQFSISNDSARMALDLWQMGKDNPYAWCLPRASHIRRLDGFGAHADVEFAFRADTCPVVPRLEDGRLTR